MGGKNLKTHNILQREKKVGVQETLPVWHVLAESRTAFLADDELGFGGPVSLRRCFAVRSGKCGGSGRKLEMG